MHPKRPVLWEHGGCARSDCTRLPTPYACSPTTHDTTLLSAHPHALEVCFRTHTHMQSLTHSLPCNHSATTSGVQYLSCMVAFIYVGVCWVTMRPRLWSKKHGESRAVSEHYPAGGTTHARPCYVTLYGHACPEGPRGPALSVKTFV